VRTFARRMYGKVAEPAEIVSHSRPLLAGSLAMGLAFDRFANSLDRSLKELATLRAAQLIGCEWCLDFGSRLARDSGVPESKLRELSRWRDSEVFDPAERLVLEYADAMTRTPVEVPDALFDRLKARFDEREIVELTVGIAFENLASRSNWALGIESQDFSEGSYCVRPETAAESVAAVAAAR
jgi:AhpD family alkylhydroperoxidase